MAAEQAGHLHGIAATGEATTAIYAAGKRLESAGLSLLRRHIADASTASAIGGISDSVSGGIMLIAGLLERLIAAVEGAVERRERPTRCPAMPTPFEPDHKHISLKYAAGT